MIDDDVKTVWCGNIAEQVTEEILYELFLQAGPLEKVRIAKDRDGRQKNFAFITYCHEVSVPYALNLFRGTALYHRTLTLQSRGRVALLPPPIRCYGIEPPIDFNGPNNVTQQFVEMTKTFNDREFASPSPLQDKTDKLVMASLQGKWNARHHPYRPSDQNPHGRDDFRPRDNRSDNFNNRNKHSNNWRDRRNSKKGNFHRY